jgi:hypothetical protein
MQPSGVCHRFKVAVGLEIGLMSSSVGLGED